ncbi:MAG: hypothetical protein LBI49_21680 [Nocardiopsaceae bacterium]|jgi:sigma-E factor negative regulatory protein RseB|nr:hypothetical protein [Nocardiopsaceae bacterium]
MRPRLDSPARGAAGGPPPGTDPVCLWITTVAVVAGLVAGLVTAGQPGPEAVPGGRPAQAALLPPTASRLPQQSGAGLRLLGQAAAACQSVTFQGVQVLTWWGQAGASAAAVTVWHRRDRAALTQAARSPAAWPRGMHRPAQAQTAGLDLPSAIDMTARQVLLLAANYRVAAGGQGRVAGRAVRIVTVRRRDGTLAARFWLDRATRLPLRRDVYATTGALAGSDAFVSLRVGSAAAAGMPGPAARPWPRDLAFSQLVALRGRGWPVPDPLPGHLLLVDARETASPAGRVVHLAYSDGLSLVSVFVQRGHLPTVLTGWRAVGMAGHRVYADDPDGISVAAWSAHGFVYTLIGQAPAATVGQVVAALPHSDRQRAPGLLGRLRLGAHRLLNWLTLSR